MTITDKTNNTKLKEQGVFKLCNPLFSFTFCILLSFKLRSFYLLTDSMRRPQKIYTVHAYLRIVSLPQDQNLLENIKTLKNKNKYYHAKREL